MVSQHTTLTDSFSSDNILYSLFPFILFLILPRVSRWTRGTSFCSHLIKSLGQWSLRIAWWVIGGLSNFWEEIWVSSQAWQNVRKCSIFDQEACRMHLRLWRGRRGQNLVLTDPTDKGSKRPCSSPPPYYVKCDHWTRSYSKTLSYVSALVYNSCFLFGPLPCIPGNQCCSHNCWTHKQYVVSSWLCQGTRPN